MSFVRCRLEADSVNVFKTAFRDRRRRRTATYDWEPPLARLARLLTAILTRPLEKGLRPSPDGSFPVKDLLQLPVLRGLDFFSIERAIRRHRSQHIALTYKPRITDSPAADESITSWWVSLCPSKTYLPPRRLLPSDEVPDLVFKLPSALWDTVREQGITRWTINPLIFNSRHIVSAKYSGDFTFIRLDPQKLIDSTKNHPIHSSTRKHSTRPVFHELSETFTTNAPLIPPSTFISATRIAVERFPLMVPASTLSNNRKQKRPPKKKRRKKEKEEEEEEEKQNQPEKMVVLQSGIDALEKFGYGDVLRGTKLLKLWKEQQAKTTNAQPVSNQNQKPSQERAATNQVASPTLNPKKSRRLSTKDPPPHITRL